MLKFNIKDKKATLLLLCLKSSPKKFKLSPGVFTDIC